MPLAWDEPGSSSALVQEGEKIDAFPVLSFACLYDVEEYLVSDGHRAIEAPLRACGARRNSCERWKRTWRRPAFRVILRGSEKADLVWSAQVLSNIESSVLAMQVPHDERSTRLRVACSSVWFSSR
jgi:hypothetical protein